MCPLSNDQTIHEESFDGLLKSALELTGIGAWSCDLRTERLSWTPAVFDIFGLPRDKSVERGDAVAMYAEPSRLMLEQLRSAAIASRTSFALEARIVRPDGTNRWIRLKAGTKVENGRAVTLYGMKQDITAERQHWEQLRRLAEHDALTGLANRTHFQARFLDRSDGSEMSAPPGALVLLDLDNLGEINRRWGLAAGDACLIAFARRLLTAYADRTFTARLGGGKFAMVLGNGANEPLLEVRARDRFSHLGEPVFWNGVPVPLSVSLGIVFVRQFQDHEAEAVYAQADLALQTAKRKEGRSPRVMASTFNGGKHPAIGLESPACPVPGRTKPGMLPLSPRETEALRHMSRGCTVDEIAHEMEVSRHTVRNFIRRVYQKLEVDTRVEAVQLAYRNGIL